MQKTWYWTAVELHGTRPLFCRFPSLPQVPPPPAVDASVKGSGQGASLALRCASEPAPLPNVATYAPTQGTAHNRNQIFRASFRTRQRRTMGPPGPAPRCSARAKAVCSAPGAPLRPVPTSSPVLTHDPRDTSVSERHSAARTPFQGHAPPVSIVQRLGGGGGGWRLSPHFFFFCCGSRIWSTGVRLVYSLKPNPTRQDVV